MVRALADLAPGAGRLVRTGAQPHSARPSGASFRPGASTSHHHDRGLLALALFKMVKAVLLVLAGVGAFSLLRPSAEARVRVWLADFSIRAGHRIIERLLHVLNVASPRQFTLVGLASICYGLRFATEGVGLWLEKRWAEYFTIVATGSLIPFEIYELVRSVTVVRVLALIANIAGVVYLIYRLRHPTGHRTG